MKLKQSALWASLFGTITFTALNAMSQQPQTIQARISGGGGSGKCTFEIRTGGTAEVDIRGGQGRVRSVNGSPVQFMRLNCNQPLPNNPNNFRFAGVDGRGRQYLVQNPNSNGGIAVIRIEDNRGGMHGYTGDIMWNGGSNNGGGGQWPGYGGGQWNAKVVPNCQNDIRNKLVRQSGGSMTFRGAPNTSQAGSFVMVRGPATYRDRSGRIGNISYQCTMHPNGNVADSKYNIVGNLYPAPQPR